MVTALTRKRYSANALSQKRQANSSERDKTHISLSPKLDKANKQSTVSSRKKIVTDPFLFDRLSQPIERNPSHNEV